MNDYILYGSEIHLQCKLAYQFTSAGLTPLSQYTTMQVNCESIEDHLKLTEVPTAPLMCWQGGSFTTKLLYMLANVTQRLTIHTLGKWNTYRTPR